MSVSPSRSGRTTSPVNDARGDPVFWIGAASCAGAVAVVAPIATALVFATLAFFLRRRRWLLVAVAVAFIASAVRADRVISRYERARRAVVELGGWPARCTARGTVTRSPTLVGGGLRLDVEEAEVTCPEREPVRGHIAVHVPIDDAKSPPDFGRGDEVALAASLAPPYRFWNDGLDDPRAATARRGVVLSGGAEDVIVTRRGWGMTSLLDRMRRHARERIEATFPSETSSMARALVLGEDDLPESDQRAFRRSGLAHLLAVSGMHLVLVVMGLVTALRAVLVRIPPIAARTDVMRVAALVGVPVAWLYADVAGGSGSAIRAAWMCTITLLARVWARPSAAARALGLSIACMSIASPLVTFDVSFVLSALATLGLLALSRPIAQWMTERVRPFGRPLPGFLVTPLATTAAATIACAPILATMAPELPLSGLVANVVAVPLGELAALPLCLVHGVLASWPAAENGCAVAASGALYGVRAIARAFTWGALPIPPPTAGQLAVIASAAVAMTFRPSRLVGLGAVVAVGLLELFVRVDGAPHGVLRVTFLDVGQGDSAIIDLPDGSAMLVDGGGLVGSPIDVGERVVAAVLSARRRNGLAVTVLSHPHPDHFLGLPRALSGRRLSAFWDTGQGEAEGTAGAYAALLGELRGRGVSVLGPNALCGTHVIGGATIEVLAPCPGPNLDRGANDNSFVFRVRYGERAVLFVGDAEHEEERELAVDAARLRADVLKVGHHGSRTSTSPAWLEAVRPTAAVISCGVRNRFGHPHPATLASLERASVEVYRTDRDGSVVVTTDGRALDVRSLARR